MIDSTSLRISAGLLLVGQLLYIAASLCSCSRQRLPERLGFRGRLPT